MSLLERINDDLVKALKGGDKAAALTLRGLKSDFKYYQIDKKLESLTDQDVIAVMTTAAKKRRDSIEQFQTGGRADLVAKETRELEIILQYLPPPLTAEELEAAVKEAIAETGAAGPGDMGKVMKVIVPKLQGKADGKVIKDAVMRLLTAR
ncbi:MAG: GatB/YqeY domain-containing protein [candidate division Zixibacteria bacterium]|nr:GatB/YqeY domain-containing protein [candidate division Zixibacteria bacterium]